MGAVMLSHESSWLVYKLFVASKDIPVLPFIIITVTSSVFAFLLLLDHFINHHWEAKTVNLKL